MEAKEEIKISVIMPVYLGKYKEAGIDRENKLVRAVSSVLEQSYSVHEIIIIADGCKRTPELIHEYFSDNDPIRLIEIPKQKNFSGIPRNEGINAATGDIICYLDSDDYFGVDHMKKIAEKFDYKNYPWCFFDDMTYYDGRFSARGCKLYHGRCGTSNIAHRTDIKERWNLYNSYGSDDWGFIKKLLHHKFQRIGQAQYCVCHIPKRYDV